VHRFVAPRGYVDESWPRTFGEGLALGATHFLLFGDDRRDETMGKWQVQKDPPYGRR
jgi:hypothetical protein